MKEYDIIIIGAGAGTKLVTPPAQLGKKVAIFEKESPGGTCLNRGCIPSKMMIYPTELLWASAQAEKFSLSIREQPKADFSQIIEQVSKTVDADSASIPIGYAKNPNIDYFPHLAKFISDKVIEANGETYTAKEIFIAVGTIPHLPQITGLEDTPYWTSREALRATSLPKSMIVIGLGFIGLELGAAYQAYGCQVEGFTRTQILRGVDNEVRQEFESHLPFPMHTHFTFESVAYENELFTLTGKNQTGERISASAEKLLISTGLQPNTSDLGLENTKIRKDENGYIEVNEFLETDVACVYAFGDVIGRYFFRHSANFEGEYLFRNLYQEDNRQPISYPPMPGAIFTHPQMASVGLTEEEIIQLKIPYYKGVNRYSSSAMGMARKSEVGFVKVLIDKENQTLLGAHIIGDEASDMIHHLILAMNLKATLTQLLNMIYIHPALPEIVRNALRKIRDQIVQNKETKHV